MKYSRSKLISLLLLICLFSAPPAGAETSFHSTASISLLSAPLAIGAKSIRQVLLHGNNKGLTKDNIVLSPGSSLLDIIRRFIVVIDFDDTVVKTDTSIRSNKKNLERILNVLRAGHIVIVATGRHKEVLYSGLVEPVIQQLGPEEKHLLNNLHLVTEQGAEIFKVMPSGELETLQEPEEEILPRDLRREIINEMLEVFYGQLSNHLNKKEIAAGIAFGEERVENVLRRNDARQKGEPYPSDEIVIIPEALREKVGEIRITNKRRMVSFVGKDEHPAIKISEILRRMIEKFRTGQLLAEHGLLNATWGEHFYQISSYEKGPAVKSVAVMLPDVRAPRQGTLILTMGDSRGDLSMMRLSYDNIPHVRVFVGGDSSEISEARDIENMVITHAKKHYGGGQVLELIANANGMTIGEFIDKLQALSVPQAEPSTPVEAPKVLGAVSSALEIKQSLSWQEEFLQYDFLSVLEAMRKKMSLSAKEKSNEEILGALGEIEKLNEGITAFLRKLFGEIEKEDNWDRYFGITQALEVFQEIAKQAKSIRFLPDKNVAKLNNKIAEAMHTVTQLKIIVEAGVTLADDLDLAVPQKRDLIVRQIILQQAI